MRATEMKKWTSIDGVERVYRESDGRKYSKKGHRNCPGMEYGNEIFM
jgi:hypothetical protein